MKNALGIALVFALVATAYSADAFGRKSRDASMEPPATTKPPAASPAQNAALLTGKVVETMSSGGYTYINIEKDNDKIWVAIPKSVVETGQEVSVIAGMSMPNFESRSLNRTFDSIMFSPGLAGGASAEPEPAPQASSTQVSFAAEKITVEKASGPDAYTVAELYDKRSDLEEKNVVVRGKVVKVSTGIMDTNWIHIQDGSGDASNGTNDLLITSDDVPSVGDVITATGTLVNDKDIGSGYKFAVMIEKATVKK